MENKANRIEIAETIYAQLIANENNAMALWQANLTALKLDDQALPKLDVLTCVYNAEAFVAHAIESILWQSYPNIHLVIVTDPCTDNTIAIIESYCAKYPNITLVQNQEHKGIIDCFNIGLNYCESDYIARMDLDDLIHPLRFEKQMHYLLSHLDIDVVSCFMRIFDEQFQTKDVTYREDMDMQKITTLFYSPLSHAGSIFKANVLQSLKYVQGYVYAEDYNLWYRILKQFRTHVYPEFLYLYRTHSNQVTNTKNTEIIRASLLLILSKNLNDLNIEWRKEQALLFVNTMMLHNQSIDQNNWMHVNALLQDLIRHNAPKQLFNQRKLKSFIYLNYWLPNFEQVYKHISFRDLLISIQSDCNIGSTSNNIKTILKYYTT